MNDANNFKVAHVSTDDIFGAGRAAARINHALKVSGIESELLILRGGFNGGRVIETSLDFIRACTRVINSLGIRRYSPDRFFQIERLGVDGDFIRCLQEYDVINLHWINGGWFSYRFLNSIELLDKPIVWTMHDMWTFTGGCHYSGKCTNYKEYCSNCEAIKSFHGQSYVADQLQKKIHRLVSCDIQFVGCSCWITEEINDSSLGKAIQKKAVTIPNPINNEIFYHVDMRVARKKINIDTKKRIIGFGAVNSMSEQRKGYCYLKEVLRRLDPSTYSIIIFGDDKLDKELNQFDVYTFGYIDDDRYLKYIYNACNVFLAPSLQENLANTVMESLSCGTPVVAFDVGGMRDMISNHDNGYLIKPFSIDEYVDAIEMAANIHGRKDISLKTQRRFSQKHIAERYINLYISLLKERMNYETSINSIS